MGVILETNALNNKEIDNLKYIDTHNNLNTNGNRMIDNNINNKDKNLNPLNLNSHENRRNMKENLKK